MRARLTLIISFSLALTLQAFCQCSNTTVDAIGDSAFCGIAIGNLDVLINTTIPASPSYVWTPSTGLSNASIKNPMYTLTSSTNYALKVTLQDNYNWIVNGDFENGNTGFTTGLAVGTGGTWGLLSNAGTYAITTNSSLVHNNFVSCTDHTPGAGNNKMMVVNGSTVTNQNVWCQSVAVNPNTQYRVIMWAASVVASSPASLRFRINGVNVGPPLNLPTSTCSWQNVNFVWNSGNATNANICIRNSNINGAGNDFALDDISFREICVFHDSVTISLNGGYQKIVDTTICSGFSYYAGGQNQTTSGIYIDTLAPGAVCDSLLITNLTVVDVPFDLGKDSTYCQGDSVILSAFIPNSTYLWQDNSVSSSLTAFATNNYAVTVTTQEGCQRADSVQLNFNPLPVVSLGNDSDYCDGDSILLDAFYNGATYVWQNNSTQSEIVATSTNLYSVTVTSQDGCEYNDDVNLTFFLLPVVDLGKDSAYCSGDSILLDASYPAATYLWHNNSSQPTMTATVSDIYSVTVTGPGGCSTLDSVNILFHPEPVVDLGEDTLHCGVSIKLSVLNPGASYLWNDGSTDPIKTVIADGTYSVKVSIGQCERSDTVNVLIKSHPVVSITGPSEVCIGDLIQLEAAGGILYSWSTGDLTPDIQVVGVISDWYTVSVSDTFCSSIDSQFVMITDSNSAEITGDALICDNETAMLNVVGSGKYLWSTGDTSASINITAASSATFYVTASGGSCPDALDSFYIEVVPTPTLSMDTVIEIKAGESIQLNVMTNANNILWSPATDISCTNCFDPVVNPQVSTYYTAVVWIDTLDLCKTEDSVLLKINLECENFILPSAFSPNGDDLNDLFRLLSFGGVYEDLQFTIWNRWGDEVYSSSEITDAWDGSKNGNYLPSGTYVWSLSYRCLGEDVQKVGNISLIR